MIMHQEFLKLKRVIVESDFDSEKLHSNLSHKFEIEEINQSMQGLIELANSSDDKEWLKFFESAGSTTPKSFSMIFDQDLAITIGLTLMNIVLVGSSIFTIIEF